MVETEREVAKHRIAQVGGQFVSVRNVEQMLANSNQLALPAIQLQPF